MKPQNTCVIETNAESQSVGWKCIIKSCYHVPDPTLSPKQGVSSKLNEQHYTEPRHCGGQADGGGEPMLPETQRGRRHAEERELGVRGAGKG